MPEKKDTTQDDINPHLRSRFELEMSSILEDFSSDQDLDKSMERIFQCSNTPDELESKLTILLSKYAENLVSQKEMQATHEIQDVVQREITKFCCNLTCNLGKGETHSSRDSLDKRCILTIESRKNLQREIQNFTIYLLYKVLNPKRISGETAKGNYINNLIARGKNVAGKYTGGQEKDLKKYTDREINAMQKQAALARKGSFSR
ncbi:MAG: hypothetical protein COA94_01800 [Rickettsiales bacterium]|nr:MAG: hypothetical protein COA94_01800 [Rickettsiales bacterium]